MDIFSAIILGLVQGLTEFIPVSSSGHLIVTRDILGIGKEGSLAFDSVLQLATGLAVLLYFWKDWLHLIQVFFRFVARKSVESKDKNILGALIVGTIPAIVIGLLLEEYMDTVFRNAHLVAGTLVVGSVIMWCAEKYAMQNSAITPAKGLGIGFFQALALVPGISRSGATISGGLFMGLTREDAARFSFLLATPIILGSGLKKLLDIIQVGGLATEGIPLLVGSVVSFVVGLIAIHWLLRYLRTRSLTPFIWYRVFLAIVILIFL